MSGADSDPEFESFEITDGSMGPGFYRLLVDPVRAAGLECPDPPKVMYINTQPLLAQVLRAPPSIHTDDEAKVLATVVVPSHRGGKDGRKAYATLEQTIEFTMPAERALLLARALIEAAGTAQAALLERQARRKRMGLP